MIGRSACLCVLFVALGALSGGDARLGGAADDVAGRPDFGSLLIAFNAVAVARDDLAIYREGGILKRLRATPLRPTRS